MRTSEHWCGPFQGFPPVRIPPGCSGTYRRSAKAPLADQGWCSAQRIKIEMIASDNHTIICAAPVRTLGLRGSELAHSDNPSVMALRETAMPAPFAQGSLWVLPHQCVYRYFSEEPENCTTFMFLPGQEPCPRRDQRKKFLRDRKKCESSRVGELFSDKIKIHPCNLRFFLL